MLVSHIDDITIGNPYLNNQFRKHYSFVLAVSNSNYKYAVQWLNCLIYALKLQFSNWIIPVIFFELQPNRANILGTYKEMTLPKNSYFEISVFALGSINIQQRHNAGIFSRRETTRLHALELISWMLTVI